MEDDSLFNFKGENKMMEIVKIEINELTDPPFVALYAKEKGNLSYQYRYVGQVWKTGEGIGLSLMRFPGERWIHFTPKQFIEFTNKIKALEYRGLESTTREPE